MAKAENNAMRAGRSLSLEANETDADFPGPAGNRSVDGPTLQRVVDLYYLSRRGVRWISAETGLSMDEVRKILQHWRQTCNKRLLPAVQAKDPEDEMASADPPLPTPSPIPPPEPAQDDAQRKARLALLLDAGLSPQEVTARTGFSEAEVWRALGLRCRVSTGYGTGSAKSEEFYRRRHARALALAADGWSPIAVADRLGLTVESIKRDAKLVRVMENGGSQRASG